MIQSHVGPYSVYTVDDLGREISAQGTQDRHFILDAHVAQLYAKALKPVLDSPSVLLIEASEDNKSLEKFPAYIKHLVNHGLRRNQTLVGIGGGIIQDITCFLAATMLRGVEWEFWPTTLLAQADSCIGSKSSINSSGTKNILGTFTPPKRIFMDVSFLDTLDEKDVRSGVGEMLKVHVIDGLLSFGELAQNYEQLFEDKVEMRKFILRSLQIKKVYIEQDEFDRGPRNIFNYGHTFGHAIEAATHFSIPHGIAVTIGMDMANWVSACLGVGLQQHFETIHPVLRKNYNGYETHPVSMEPFIAAILKDKKNIGVNNVMAILLTKNGILERSPCPADQGFIDICDHFLNTVRSS